ncbi:MAG: hypothetical protein AVDCRST_MAG16-682, partial [uncultured Frankineae bacterium]
ERARRPPGGPASRAPPGPGASHRRAARHPDRRGGRLCDLAGVRRARAARDHGGWERLGCGCRDRRAARLL